MRLQVGGLEVVGPQDPQVVLGELTALFLDDGGAHLEVSVVGGVVLLHAGLHRLGLEARLGGVVDAAGEVAVGRGDERGVPRVEEGVETGQQLHGFTFRWGRGRDDPSATSG